MVEHNSKDENYTEAQVYFKPIIQTKKGFYRVLRQKKAEYLRVLQNGKC